jgi:hypothetical protein
MATTIRYAIELDVESNFNLKGFEAIDFCRKFGLPETTKVETSIREYPARFDVDEAFSRQFFDLPETDGLTTFLSGELVAVSDLRPGDLVKGDGDSTLKINPEMPADRAKELFVLVVNRRRGAESI